MSEWIRTHRGTRWVCLVSACVLAFVAAQIVAASPLQNQKKASTDSAKKSQPDSSPVTNKAPSLAAIAAVVNGEEISYKALAEEVIARNGAEVLETMIARLLVDQACRESGIKITSQELQDEVARTADKLGMTTESYLKLLEKEKNIKYEQYIRDIVWPGLALKKMARPKVKVTDDDIEKGFEAYYGEKMKCRWIMLTDLNLAMKVWNELKDADKGSTGKVELAEFERQVTRWSADQGTRSLGGQLQPIGRHTGPAFQEIEKAAFALKEDGNFSSVLQFGGAYVILYREGRLPPAKVKLEDVRSKIESDIYDAKMRDQIEQVFLTLRNQATVVNNISGDVMSRDKKTVPAEHVEKSDASKAASGKSEPQKKPATPPKK